jgi:hypothetical protein
MMSQLNWETLQTKGQELAAQSKELIDLARATGKSYVDTARSTLETEAKGLLGRVREAEVKGQAVLQDRFARQLAQLRSLEGELRGRAEKIAADVRPQVVERVPALAPVLDRVEELVKTVDGRLQGWLAGAAAHAATPIEGYDDLSAKAVVAELADLDAATLQAVRAYEVANKNRVTVIREIDAKLA